jgi:hypothetical protein
VFAYPDTPANTFVLAVHDGTVAASGRELEAEPLRHFVEGSRHNPYALETIGEKLAALVGMRIEFEQHERSAQFAVVQAKRMSANDVSEYLYKPMELSTFMDPIASAETSFLLLFCSARQPDEPQRPFPGRFVLVVEEIPGN